MTPDQVDDYLLLKKMCHEKKLALRAEACDWAAKERAIEEKLTPELMKEYEDWKKLMEIYK